MNHILLHSLAYFSFLFLTATAQEPILSKDLTEETRQEKREIYQAKLKELNSYRTAQAKVFHNATPRQKRTILNEVRTHLETELCQNIFPAWYGTKWDFNGTSKTPGEGKIACGYFVSACLVHVGFNVPRIRLAQQPSQRIIKTFMPRTAMDISSKRSLPDIKKQLMKSGNGIYIVGLDTHVGFVTVKDETITFVHSSYYRATNKSVTAEPYDTKNPLADSKYRVFGKIFHDDMLIKWLYQTPITVAR